MGIELGMHTDWREAGALTRRNPGVTSFIIKNLLGVKGKQTPGRKENGPQQLLGIP